MCAIVMAVATVAVVAKSAKFGYGCDDALDKWIKVMGKEDYHVAEITSTDHCKYFDQRSNDSFFWQMDLTFKLADGSTGKCRNIQWRKHLLGRIEIEWKGECTPGYKSMKYDY